MFAIRIYELPHRSHGGQPKFTPFPGRAIFFLLRSKFSCVQAEWAALRAPRHTNLQTSSGDRLNPVRTLLLSSLLAGATIALGLADSVADASGQQAESQADSVRKYRFLAKASREQKDHAAAARHYRKVLTYNPGDQKAHYFLGTCLVKQKQLVAAKEAFLESNRLDSTHLNTNLALTQIFLSEEQPDSARRFLAKIGEGTRGRQRRLELRRQLADQYRRQGRVAEAIAQYQILVEVREPAAKVTRKDRADLLKMLVDLHREAGLTVEALAWQQRLLDHHGDWQRSVADLDTARSRDRPGHSAERVSILNDLVELQASMGSTEAYGTLRELAELDPENRYAYYERLLHMATERDDGPRRLEGLEGMVRANPNDIPTLAVLAEFHLDRQELAPADRWLQRGLGVDPEDGHLLVLMGDLQVVKGSEEEALSAFHRATADPEWEAVARQRIWQIRPPETAEEKLKREFFGNGEGGGGGVDGK